MENRQALHKRLLRLGKILKYFAEEEMLSSNTLSNRLNISIRTVQRDLLFLKQAGFPVNETDRGVYTLDKNIIKKYDIIDDTEIALIVAMKNMVTQLGAPFQKAADSLFNRLYDAFENSPVFIHIQDATHISPKMFYTLVRAIMEKKRVAFNYQVYSIYQVLIEPYRLAYFEGLWYLFGKDTRDNKIKRYALDKMSDARITKTVFKDPKESIDGVLESSANIWFDLKKNITVEILVDPDCAGYFKRRKIFPTQELGNEEPDGRLHVSFKVGGFDEIKHILKSWFPHIEIISPDKLRTMLVADMKRWVVRQEMYKKKA